MHTAVSSRIAYCVATLTLQPVLTMLSPSDSGRLSQTDNDRLWTQEHVPNFAAACQRPMAFWHAKPGGQLRRSSRGFGLAERDQKGWVCVRAWSLSANDKLRQDQGEKLLDEQYGWFGKELLASILQVMVHHADRLAESGGCMRAVATLPGHVQWSDIATATGGSGQMGSSLHSVGCWPPSAERGPIAPHQYRHVELDITPEGVSVLVTPGMAMPPPTDAYMHQVLSADLSISDMRQALMKRTFQRAVRALQQAVTDGKLQPADLQSLLPLVPPTTISAAQALWHATAQLQLEADLDGGESLWADTPSKFDEVRRSVGLELLDLPGVWFAFDLPGAIYHCLKYHAAQLHGSMRAFALLKGHTQVPHVSPRSGTGVCMEDVRLWPPTVEAGTDVYPRIADPACRHVELIISLREVGEAEVRVLPGLPPM